MSIARIYVVRETVIKTSFSVFQTAWQLVLSHAASFYRSQTV